MTQPLARRSALRTALIALILVPALACAKTDRHQTDSEGAVASTSTQQPRTPLPGTLAKAIDQYTGEEFFALTHRMRFAGGNERARRCRGRAECRGANAAQATSVRVDAVDQQDSLSAKAVPVNGVVALRAVNRGLIADTMYSMRPTARFEYYLIVLPGTNGGKATWRLEELDAAQGIRAHRTVARGTVTECNHPFVRGARADFKSCTSAAQVRPASFGTLQINGPEDPLWFACSAGCCMANSDERSG